MRTKINIQQRPIPNDYTKRQTQMLCRKALLQTYYETIDDRHIKLKDLS